MSTQEKTPEYAVAMFRCLSTPARVAVFQALGDAPKRVTTLAGEVGQNFNQVSTTLRMMMDAGLVDYEPDGPFHYYHLTDYGMRVRDVMRSREAE